jgi:hypothetical protein
MIVFEKQSKDRLVCVQPLTDDTAKKDIMHLDSGSPYRWPD